MYSVRIFVTEAFSLKSEKTIGAEAVSGDYKINETGVGVLQEAILLFELKAGFMCSRLPFDRITATCNYL